MDKIQEIKEKYGQQAESIIADGLNLVSKGKKYRCPNNIAHKNGDRNPSMSWHNQALQFYCFACDMKIDLYEYYKNHLNYSHQEIIHELLGEEQNKRFEEERKSFKSEANKVHEINEKTKKYVMSRGIKEEAIKKFDLRSSGDAVVFPYYKYETIIGYKVRNLEKNKKMWGISGSKPFLFNFQNLDDNFEELIICEGEFDCMIIDQCGFNNVVSVGAGANSLSSLVKQCKDILDKYENLIIVSDNDDAGESMDETFVKEFGLKARLTDKKLYTQNDINAEHFKHGEEKVKEIIESARLKVEGRRDLDKVPYKGLEKKVGKYIPTGTPSIDYAINDLAPGCVTVIVGRTNAGKTTFTKQIISNAINNGNKVFCVSGEGDQEVFINEIYKNVIGRNQDYFDTVKINKRFHKEPKREVQEALEKWHKGKLVVFSKGESKLKSIEELFNMISYEIKIKKHNLVVIDNMMSLLTVSNNGDKNQSQGDFMQKCCDIAKAYSTHIVVVVHPRKPAGGKIQEIDIENISGSMDIGNKADNIISVSRKKQEEGEDDFQEGGEIEVLKNRYYSELPKIDTYFDKDTGLLLEIDNIGNVIGYKFDWQKYLNKNFVENIDIFSSNPDDPF